MVVFDSSLVYYGTAVRKSANAKDKYDYRLLHSAGSFELAPDYVVIRFVGAPGFECADCRLARCLPCRPFADITAARVYRYNFLSALTIVDPSPQIPPTTLFRPPPFG